MIGKRRFIVVLVSVILTLAVEGIAQFTGTPGVSVVTGGALIGMVGAYVGFDSQAKKAKYASSGPAEAQANP